jgi:hypothetical protein
MRALDPDAMHRAHGIRRDHGSGFRLFEQFLCDLVRRRSRGWTR